MKNQDRDTGVAIRGGSVRVPVLATLPTAGALCSLVFGFFDSTSGVATSAACALLVAAPSAWAFAENRRIRSSNSALSGAAYLSAALAAFTLLVPVASVMAIAARSPALTLAGFMAVVPSSLTSWLAVRGVSALRRGHWWGR